MMVLPLWSPFSEPLVIHEANRYEGYIGSFSSELYPHFGYERVIGNGK